jgi:Flp pilus assembly protein CpaB
MTKRARAIAFGAAALGCAALAAALAGGYRADLASQLGPLRPVVVARAQIPSGQPLGPAQARRLLEVRRVPERFAPAGALSASQQAIGHAPAVRIPAGAYLLAALLEDPGSRRRGHRPRLAGARKPVEISVTGAEALEAAGGARGARSVDVIVTTEPGPGGGSGRTYVAAEHVRLLALGRSGDSDGGVLSGAGSGAWAATLALTRAQALRLIQAENFARQVRLIPH